MQEFHLLLQESYRSWNDINQLYCRWAKRHGMTHHALFTLYAIYNDPGHCCSSSISEEWSIPKQTVSSILKVFDQKGYLLQLPSPDDRRNKHLALTSQGRRYADQVLLPLRQLELATLKQMGAPSCQAMNQYNDQFYRLLRQEMEGTPT